MNFCDFLRSKGARTRAALLLHEPAESIALRRQYRVDNNTALEFFSTMMEKRAGGISREDDSTIDTIYKSYRKNRKEFFTDIADFLGEDCEAMKDRRHGGYYLKDYMLKKAVLAALAALAALSSAHRKQLSCSKCVGELHFG